MFDMVLKNTVLFILFILILHFSIKNRLLDEGFVVSPSMPGTIGLPFTGNTSLYQPPRYLDTLQLIAPTDESRVAPATQKLETTQLKELYDYVFNEDSKKELDTYFKADTPKEEQTHKLVRCDVNSSQAYASTKMCESAVDKEFDMNAKTAIMETNHSFYKVYPSEGIQNGGMIDNIMGFSSMKDEYEQF